MKGLKNVVKLIEMLTDKETEEESVLIYLDEISKIIDQAKIDFLEEPSRESTYEKTIRMVKDGHRQVDIAKNLKRTSGLISRLVKRAKEKGRLE